MKVLNYEPRLPDLPLRRVEDMGLKELERIRLILRGGSVIDWRRLHFGTRAEIDRFLRLCLLDPEDKTDESWMRAVLADAVEYLRKTFNYRVTDAVAHPKEIHDLFLYASGLKEPESYRRIACIALKVMHVIQHIEGRDLLFRLAISEEELGQRIIEKVTEVVSEMQRKGVAMVEFSHSVKSRDSLITKLLAKRETVAAQIYDKTRFRIVTKNRSDVVPALYYLTQRLFPFNFVVPNQSENSLISFRHLLEAHPHFREHIDDLHLDLDYEEWERRPGNEFSSSDYRVLNFVVDIPLRMDNYLPPKDQDVRARKCRIGFALVEFQILDEHVAKANEAGESAHSSYKRRQKRRVLRRLSAGLVVPKKRPS
ncbi:MAG: TIGR04552 family protein [Myxococcaceae bacterium]